MTGTCVLTSARDAEAAINPDARVKLSQLIAILNSGKPARQRRMALC